jgi:hypothetical protein
MGARPTNGTPAKAGTNHRQNSINSELCAHFVHQRTFFYAGGKLRIINTTSKLDSVSLAEDDNISGLHVPSGRGRADSIVSSTAQTSNSGGRNQEIM